MSETKETKKTAKAAGAYAPRLKALYKEKVLPALLKEMKVKSPMAAPKLEKIVINVGVADAKEDIKFMDIAREDITVISGQLAQVRRAKKSISNFKLREGMPIGVKVTLRGDRMYEFFDRFVNVVAPRIRDFQGFNPKGFDGRGNLNVGLKEHYVFPEIDVEKSPKAHGMNITFATTAKNDDNGRLLMEFMGFPFRKGNAK
ncbi:MAG: 50S ribosomal protein L5 [Elusimicrobiota bacterium]|jgi:large subunit ribosomal protein L5|nr:50S ribosomal protein L5 [Elusimicrobiota bacterium]